LKHYWVFNLLEKK